MANPTPGKHFYNFACPRCDSPTFIRSKRTTKSGLIRYRECECGYKFVNDVAPDGTETYKCDVTERKLKVPWYHKAKRMTEDDSDLPPDLIWREVVNSVAAAARLAIATKSPLKIDPATYELAECGRQKRERMK